MSEDERLLKKQIIKFGKKNLYLRKAVKTPHFDSQNVIVTNIWDYIEMWMMKERGKVVGRSSIDDAIFYWKQAEAFYKASINMDKISKPLLQYYCILNASKAFLKCKSISFEPYHGLKGWNKGAGKVSLETEMIQVKNKGVLPAVARYFGNDSIINRPIDLKKLLYNIPFIHRAYGLTFKNSPNLFIPVIEGYFIKNNKSKESWFSYKFLHVPKGKNKVKQFWEPLRSNSPYYRPKNSKFRSSKVLKKSEMNGFKNYYQKIRVKFSFISGNEVLWYLKRDDYVNAINANEIVIMFSVLHRLSELSRYSPVHLRKHFASKHNWLITEFINNVLDQYIDQLACELCGHDLMPPAIRSR